MGAIEDERKQAEQYKQQVKDISWVHVIICFSQADKQQSRVRSLKRAVEEAEEENARLQASKRRAQREVDELQEQLEILQRDLRSKS